MKKFKKLIPTLCMLLISAVLMGTSTYAWFSMNTKVTATGMQVNAKAENKFLQIIAGTDAFSDTTAQTSAEAKNASKEVRPVTAVQAVVTTVGASSITKLTTENATSVMAADIKWAEAFSNDPTSSTKATDYTDVSLAAVATEGNTNKYTLVNTFKVRLNAAMGVKTAANLAVQSVTIAATGDTAKNELLPAVRVLITCGDNWVIYNKDGKVVGNKADSSIIAETVTDTTPSVISVYIFFDGEDPATTTNNASTVGTDGYKVEFVLAID